MAGSARGRITPRTITPGRVQAWTVLANLFLDTTHSPDLLRAFSRDMRATGFSPDELEAMLKREVAPVFGGNLLSTAGEWALWDETEVLALMQQAIRPDGTFPLSRRLLGGMTYKMAWGDWIKIRELL